MNTSIALIPPSFLSGAALLASASILLSVPTAQAVDLYWGATTVEDPGPPEVLSSDGNWGVASNWFTDEDGDFVSSATPTASDDVFLNTTPNNALGGRIDMVNTSINSITYNTSGNTTLNLNGSTKTFTLGAGGLETHADAGSLVLGISTHSLQVNFLTSQTWTNNSSSLVQIRNAAKVSDSAIAPVVVTFNAAGSGNITASGNLADGTTHSFGLIVDSAGTGAMNLPNATFTGGTTIKRGLLQSTGQIGDGIVNLGHTSGSEIATLRINTTTAIANDLNVQANGGTNMLEFSHGTSGTWDGDIVLNGTLNVGARNVSAGTTINGEISGVGNFVKSQYQGGTSGKVTLAAANDYSGTTTIQNGSLVASVDGSLGGTSTITIEGTANLTLGTGVATATGFVNNLASIILNGSSSTLTLDYIGTDSITGLQANGFTFDPGLYTASEANTLASSTQFSGTGTLFVIPEPGTVALLLGGFGMLLGFQRTRRRQ